MGNLLWVLQLSGDCEEGLGDAEWTMSASHPGSRPMEALLHVPMSPSSIRIGFYSSKGGGEGFLRFYFFNLFF